MYTVPKIKSLPNIQGTVTFQVAIVVFTVNFFLNSGGNGIWLDENLNHGRSEICNTFHNRVLTKGANGDFICVRLEVFRFREPEL